MQDRCLPAPVDVTVRHPACLEGQKACQRPAGCLRLPCAPLRAGRSRDVS